MALEFPRMVYRVGTMAVLMSGTYDYKLVADADELDAAQADGWHLDEDAAKEAHDAAAEAAKAPEAPPAPAPTTAGRKARATPEAAKAPEAAEAAPDAAPPAGEA